MFTRVTGNTCRFMFRQQNEVAGHHKLARGCHLYVIVRRPHTEIIGIKRRRDTVKATIAIGRSRRGRRETSYLPNLLFPPGSMFTQTVGKDYFWIGPSLSPSDAIYHNDPYLLLMASSDLAVAIRSQEVLYIGRASGSSLNRNVVDRLKGHETVQRIYADHQDGVNDIFVLALEQHRGALTNHVVLDDDDEPLEYTGNLDMMDYLRDVSPAQSFNDEIELCEAALIRYFQPRYNQQLRDSFPNPNLSSVKRMSRYGITRLAMSLDTSRVGVALLSPARPAKLAHGIYSQLNKKLGVLDLLEDPPASDIDLFGGAARGVDSINYGAEVSYSEWDLELPANLVHRIGK